MKILILCTGNSCRSQMAEGFVRRFVPNAEVFSAGTARATRVNPLAIQVMREAGVDISSHRSKTVDEFLSKTFDHVVTVCDNANATCPVFTGAVTNRHHFGFDDPTDAKGSDEFILNEFRRVRDEIRARFETFVEEKVR